MSSAPTTGGSSSSLSIAPSNSEDLHVDRQEGVLLFGRFAFLRPKQVASQLGQLPGRAVSWAHPHPGHPLVARSKGTKARWRTGRRVWWAAVRQGRSSHAGFFCSCVQLTSRFAMASSAITPLAGRTPADRTSLTSTTTIGSRAARQMSMETFKPLCEAAFRALFHMPIRSDS